MSIFSILFDWYKNANGIFSKILTHMTKLLAEAVILSKLSENFNQN
jgi:hypothetical protein